MIGSRLSLAASLPALRCAASAFMLASDVQNEIDDREQAVDNDEQDDARNHGPRRRVADSRRAGGRLQAAQAADAGDEDREDERLDEPGHEVAEVDDAFDLVHERDPWDRKALQRHRAADQA